MFIPKEIKQTIEHHNMKRSLIFIVNLQAKNGQCRKIWEQVSKQLAAAEIDYDVYYTEYAGHAVEIARKVSKTAVGQLKTIVAVGGDGTLHEVINGVNCNENIVIANLPAGSGNDFSRGFNIPRQPLKALKLILTEQPLQNNIIDLGKVSLQGNDFRFVNSMGAGLDAVIAAEANRSRLKKFLNLFSLGTLIYAFILFKKLFTFKTSNYEVVLDGKKRQFSSVWFIAISNQPYYGGGMKVAPKACAKDGILDITIVHNLSRLKLLLLFLTVFWGGHTGIKGVECLRGRSLAVFCNDEVLVHADGEQIGTTPFKLAVQTNKLPIMQFK